MDTEDSVYHSIEQAILEHRLIPGTRLQEVKLSSIYNVKRGLIRNVLTRLSHAKLVQKKPNQGAQVARPSLKEAQDLFATRIILEKAIVQQLCQSIRQDELDYLKNYVRNEYKAYRQGRIDEAKKLSANFHLELAKITNNSLLISYLKNIINQTPLIMLKHTHEHENSLNNDHQQIIAAIAQGDASHASHLLIEHIDKIADSIQQDTQRPSQDLFEVLKQ